MNSSRSPSVPYRLLHCPAEVIVGEPLTVTLELRKGHTVHPTDWVGLYPQQLPTLPGLSHGRWRYISACDQEKDGKIMVHFNPSSSLPNHAGVFELRIHLENQYGEPVLRSSPIHFLDAPISRIGRVFLMCLFLAVVYLMQKALNAKGSCDFIDPSKQADVIWDFFIEVTKPLNRWFIDVPTVGEFAQAMSSLLLDFGVLLLVYCSSMRRSSVRSYVALFVFYGLRFVAQIMAAIPCPPGFVWPHGKILGVSIPSIFVDYENASDFFFSGHTGCAVILGMEFFQLDYHKTAWFFLCVVTPYVATIVVSFRAHRGIDIFAALLAAVVSCSFAKDVGGVLDRTLQVRRLAKSHATQQAK